MKTLKYSRNWAYEQMCDVHFVDGSSEQCLGQTDSKGQIAFICYDGNQYTPEQFDMLEIASVHYMTPAKLEVKTSANILVDVYVRLVGEINKAIESKDADLAIRLARIRTEIADEIHKRGLNLHELMSEQIAS